MSENNEHITRAGPGYQFANRELLNITRLGLNRIYTAPDSEASGEMREAARQALARLEGLTCLSLPGAITAALTRVEQAQARSREIIPGRRLGDYPSNGELTALRDLAAAVRASLTEERST